MFLDLPHTQMDSYKVSRELVKACYQLSKKLPDSERYGLVQQIRRASTSVTINIAEGSSRKSLSERRRYYEISRGSIVEIDSILDLIIDLAFCNMQEIAYLEDFVVRCFQMLSSMINVK